MSGGCASANISNCEALGNPLSPRLVAADPIFWGINRTAGVKASGVSGKKAPFLQRSELSRRMRSSGRWGTSGVADREVLSGLGRIAQPRYQAKGEEGKIWISEKKRRKPRGGRPHRRSARGDILGAQFLQLAVADRLCHVPLAGTGLSGGHFLMGSRRRTVSNLAT